MRRRKSTGRVLGEIRYPGEPRLSLGPQLLAQDNRVQGNLSSQLQRAQTLNGQWTTNAMQTAPGFGLVEFHDPSPPSDRGFYRVFQD